MEAEWLVFLDLGDLLASLQAAIQQVLDDLRASMEDGLLFLYRPSARRRHFLLRLDFRGAREIGMRAERSTDRPRVWGWGDCVRERLLSSCASPAVSIRWAAESRPAGRRHPAEASGLGLLPQTPDVSAIPFCSVAARLRRGCRYVLARRDPCDHDDISYRGVASIS